MKNLNKLIGSTAMCLKPPKWPLWHQMGVVTFAYLGTWGWGHCKSVVVHCGATIPCATFILTYVLSQLPVFPGYNGFIVFIYHDHDPHLICCMICYLYFVFLNALLFMDEGRWRLD